MSAENHRTRAVTLLAANGAALAIAAQFTVDHMFTMTPNVAVFAFTYLVFTFTGAGLSYLLLLAVGKPHFVVRELWAAAFFCVHIVSICIGLLSRFPT